MRSKFVCTSVLFVSFNLAAIAQAQSSTEEYTYDALGRLKTVVTTGGQSDSETQSICYDKADNRTQYLANESAGATECTITGSSSPQPPGSSDPPPPPPPPGNNPPIATGDSASGQCSTSATVNLTANDTDPESNYPLNLISIVKTAGSASATESSASTITVTFGASGDASSFTYTVADSLGATSTGTFTANTTSCGGGPLL